MRVGRGVTICTKAKSEAMRPQCHGTASGAFGAREGREGCSDWTIKGGEG